VAVLTDSGRVRAGEQNDVQGTPEEVVPQLTR
jgi:hypothetical protein